MSSRSCLVLVSVTSRKRQWPACICNFYFHAPRLVRLDFQFHFLRGIFNVYFLMKISTGVHMFDFVWKDLNFSHITIQGKSFIRGQCTQSRSNFNCKVSQEHLQLSHKPDGIHVAVARLGNEFPGFSGCPNAPQKQYKHFLLTHHSSQSFSW